LGKANLIVNINLCDENLAVLGISDFYAVPFIRDLAVSELINTRLSVRSHGGVKKSPVLTRKLIFLQ
jgi:hypothetical protein